MIAESSAMNQNRSDSALEILNNPEIKNVQAINGAFFDIAAEPTRGEYTADFSMAVTSDNVQRAVQYLKSEGLTPERIAVIFASLLGGDYQWPLDSVVRTFMNGSENNQQFIREVLETLAEKYRKNWNVKKFVEQFWIQTTSGNCGTIRKSFFQRKRGICFP